jgi:hypothetical protein
VPFQSPSTPIGKLPEKDAKTITGELLGTDSGSKRSQVVLCQEYVLQTVTVVYPKNSSCRSEGRMFGGVFGAYAE